MSELGVESIGQSVLARDADGQHRLVASRCPDCGDVRVPRREFCVNDAGACEPIMLSGAGTIYEAVLVTVPPSGFAGPFWSGYIDLAEGPRVFAQIDGSGGGRPPEHGDPVRMVAREIGTRPVLAPVFVRV